MKNQFLLLLAILFSSLTSSAQIQNTRNTTDLLSIRRVASNEILYGKPVPGGEIIGSTYLEEEWSKGELTFNNGEKLTHAKVRYDIEMDQFQILIDNGKAINQYEGFDVKEVLFTRDSKTRKFIYCRSCDSSLSAILFEEIIDGNLGLLKRTELSVKDPTYIAAKDMGDRNAYILKKQSLYMKSGDKLTKLTKNNNWNLSKFPDKQKEMKSYASKNKLKFKEESDLVKLINYYNSI